MKTICKWCEHKRVNFQKKINGLYSSIFKKKKSKSGKREQDGRGVGGCGVHLHRNIRNTPSDRETQA